MRHTARLLLVILMLLTLTVTAISETVEKSEAVQGEMEPLYFHQIDIGCANGDLISVGDTVILVDCGTNTDVKTATNKELLEYLAAANVDHIDYWIVTHYHNDHAYNLDVLLEMYGTDDTVVFGPSRELPERFLPLPAGSYQQLKDGDSFSIGDIDFLCLGPASAEVNGEVNRHSLNIRMDYGDTSFMITGDYVPADLKDRHPEEIRDIDVLIFPHHGLEPFVITGPNLNKMNSSIVLMTANNRARVKRYCNTTNWLSADLYSSGPDGTIVIATDGVKLDLYTQVEPGQFTVR